MSQVFMDCPDTGKPVYVGLSLEWDQLESLEMGSVDREISHCPHCGKSHRFEKKDLFLRGDGGG